jgi:hypothetical protein
VRDPKERLRDMLEAIEYIERYGSRGKEAFERNELIRNSCRAAQLSVAYGYRYTTAWGGCWRAQSFEPLHAGEQP